MIVERMTAVLLCTRSEARSTEQVARAASQARAVPVAVRGELTRVTTTTVFGVLHKLAAAPILLLLRGAKGPPLE